MEAGARGRAHVVAGQLAREEAQRGCAVAVAQINIAAPIHEIAGARHPALLLQILQGGQAVGPRKAGVKHGNLHAFAAVASLMHGHGPDELVLGVGPAVGGAGREGGRRRGDSGHRPGGGRGQGRAAAQQLGAGHGGQRGHPRQGG